MPDQPAPHRVLLVDDIPSVREALRWAFEDEQDLLVVGEAGDGQQACEQAGSLHVDVVILDIELPLVDGFAVARWLKQLPRPPIVIFLTVHGDLPSRQEGTAAGGDGFVEKSAGWQVLLGEVRRTLRLA